MARFFRFMRYAEPARLRAIYAAAAALALALGVAIPAEVDGKLTALIGVVAVLVPLLQGEATRAVVTPAPEHRPGFAKPEQYPSGDAGDVPELPTDEPGLA